MDALYYPHYAAARKGTIIMKKSIIITGAGRGIGAAATKTFLDTGYRVGLVGRHADTLAETANGHPDALVLTGDVGCGADQPDRLLPVRPRRLCRHALAITARRTDHQ